MDEHLQSAIESLKNTARKPIEELMATPEMDQLLKIHAALNTLEDLAATPRTPLSSLLGIAKGESETPQVSRFSIRPGEYFGKSPLEAAKLFLKKKNEPATLEEIVNGLIAGSCEVRNKGDLRLSLGRSTFEIARLGEDNFGLLDWFPEEKQKRLNSAKRRGTAQSPPSVYAEIPGPGSTGGDGEDD